MIFLFKQVIFQINHLNFPGLVNFRSPCFKYNIFCWICKILRKTIKLSNGGLKGPRVDDKQENLGMFKYLLLIYFLLMAENHIILLMAENLAPQRCIKPCK